MTSVHGNGCRSGLLAACGGLCVIVSTATVSAQPFMNYFGAPNRSENFAAIEQYFGGNARGALALPEFRAIGQAPRASGPFTADYDWYIRDVQTDGIPVADYELRNPGFAEASSIEILPDGSSVIVGNRGVFLPSNDLGVARISAAGTLLWAIDLPGTGSFFDAPIVTQLPGNRLVVSARDANGDGPLLYVLTTAGTVIDAKRLTTPLVNYRIDNISDVKWDDATGTIVVCGNGSELNNGSSSPWLARIDITTFASSANYVSRFDSQNAPLYTQFDSVEMLGGGLASVYGRTFKEDPKNPGFGTEGLWLLGTDAALLPTWSNVTTLTFNNTLQSVQAGLRLNPLLGQLGVVANYTFGDGGSNMVLVRYLPDGTLLGLTSYPLDGFTFGRGMAPVISTVLPGWILAGSAQNFTNGSDPLLLRTRADGTTGCQETLEVVNTPAPLTVTPLPLVFITFGAQPNWSTFITFPDRPWAVACRSQVDRCNPADICGSGATYDPLTGGVDIGPDLALSIDDFVIFLAAFTDGTGCPGTAPCNVADICGSGATYDGLTGTVDVGPDGDLSIEDFLIFLAAFTDGTGCP